MSADIEPPAGWRKVMGPLKKLADNHNVMDVIGRACGKWDFTGWFGADKIVYAVRIGSDIDKENPPDYPAEWQGDKGWVKAEKPQPTTVRGWLETLPDGYRQRALEQQSNEVLATSLGYAIGSFASWKLTKEGAQFWGFVHDWACECRDLPPLPADPPEAKPPLMTLDPETGKVTLDDDLAERLAIAIAPAIIAEWSYNNEDLPAEIAKLAKAIAGELRK
jgi:hypothetical protein